LSDEEEEWNNDPGFEGAVGPWGSVAEDEEAEDYEEVYDGAGVAFYVEDEGLGGGGC